ncbi:hypothetical protein B0H10DRAFT_1999368, partial [Mycena sp. CBHHK59/15]
KQIQVIVDKVYGTGVHTVARKDVWVGLISYRLHTWRNGFAAQGEKAFQMVIDNDVAQGEGEVEGLGEEADEENEEQTGVTPPIDGATPDPTLPASAASTVRKFTFKTPEGIAEFVAWALQPHKEGDTLAFHWKQWGNGIDKKGFLQSELIMYTYAYHLSCLDTIPGGYKRLTDPPIGALLIAVQAVQRALQFWRTGVYNNLQPTPRANFFSSDNWDDYTVPNPNPHGKKDKLVRRATKFMVSVNKWDTELWDEVKAEAREFVEAAPVSRRCAASSRSTSEADDSMYSDDDEVIIVSD